MNKNRIKISIQRLEAERRNEFEALQISLSLALLKSSESYRKIFIERIGNPQYNLTPIDELIIEGLLKDNDGKDPRE